MRCATYRWNGRALWLCGVSAAAFAVIGAGALARSSSSSHDPVEMSFQAMMDNLSDPRLSFAYGQAAIQAGAIPHAISALERVLLRDPQLDNIRLELGLLYVTLGNAPLGQSYIEQALQNPQMPAEVRERAEVILNETRKAASPHRFTGTLTAGLRFDSNVNNAPGSPNVLLFGLPATVAPGSQATSDGSLAMLAVGRYTYDLGQQNGNRIEANGFANLQSMFQQTKFDVGAFGGDIGPWLSLPIGLAGSTEVRPYLAAYDFVYGRRQYVASGGGGLTVRHALDDAWALTAAVQATQQAFTSSPDRPTASQQTGPEMRIGAGIQYRVAGDQRVALDLGYAHKDARVGSFSYDQFGAVASYTLQYVDLTGWLNRPWSSTVSAGYRRYVYAVPDATVDPNQTRRDNRYELSATQLIGLQGSVSLMVRIDLVANDSNLPNYSYRNFSSVGGIQASF